jgi:hypothetical protein
MDLDGSNRSQNSPLLVSTLSQFNSDNIATSYLLDVHLVSLFFHLRLCFHA